MPRIERLHQNTPEWHRWRHAGNRGQRRSGDHGRDSLQDAANALVDKDRAYAGRAPAGPAARRGRELERFARRAYERQTGIQMEPLCLVHEEFEWMRASLDGLSFDGSTLLEIKCPLNLRDDRAQQGRILPVPCAAPASTGGLRSRGLHYWSFDGSDGILIEIRPDREYAKRLVEAEAAFWQLVKENVWPESADEELDLSADPKWRHAALRYREVRLRLERQPRRSTSCAQCSRAWRRRGGPTAAASRS